MQNKHLRMLIAFAFTWITGLFWGVEGGPVKQRLGKRSNPNAPGQTGQTPGQSGACPPGQSGNNPGKGNKEKKDGCNPDDTDSGDKTGEDSGDDVTLDNVTTVMDQRTATTMVPLMTSTIAADVVQPTNAPCLAPLLNKTGQPVLNEDGTPAFFCGDKCTVQNSESGAVLFNSNGMPLCAEDCLIELDAEGMIIRNELGDYKCFNPAPQFTSTTIAPLPIRTVISGDPSVAFITVKPGSVNAAMIGGIAGTIIATVIAAVGILLVRRHENIKRREQLSILATKHRTTAMIGDELFRRNLTPDEVNDQYKRALSSRNSLHDSKVSIDIRSIVQSAKAVNRASTTADLSASQTSSHNHPVPKQCSSETSLPSSQHMQAANLSAPDSGTMQMAREIGMPRYEHPPLYDSQSSDLSMGSTDQLFQPAVTVESETERTTRLFKSKPSIKNGSSATHMPILSSPLSASSFHTAAIDSPVDMDKLESTSEDE